MKQPALTILMLDHIFKQRSDGLSFVVEMLSDPDTGVAVIEVQRSVLVLHIEVGDFKSINFPENPLPNGGERDIIF